MGRRRRARSLSTVLLDSPWWVSALLALGSYIGLHTVIPAIFVSSPYLRGIAIASRSLAWVPAAVFSFLGLLAFLRARKFQSVVHASTGNASGPGKGRRAEGERGFKRVINPIPGANSNPQTPQEKPTEWSLDALKQLEWKRFEQLCVWYYEAMDFTVSTVSHGADGGIDATLSKQGVAAPVALVQCKAWRSPVKVETVRALGGSMHAKRVQRGVFWSLAGFVGQPVRDYAAEARIQLLDGASIVERIRALDQDKQAALLARAFEGDYRTPTCVACGVKLLPREGRGRLFWGCQNFSKGCRITLPRAA